MILKKKKKMNNNINQGVFLELLVAAKNFTFSTHWLLEIST